MMRGYSYGTPYGMMGTGSGGWIALLFMFGFGLLVLVGIVLLIVWAVRGAGHQAHPGPGPSPLGHEEAMAVARRRLASGEITTEQFEEIRKTLGG
jgi:putative membrane protein